MKKILILCKFINNWTNNQITAKEEAEQILKYLLLKNDTFRSVAVFEELETLMFREMQNRESEAARTCRLINSKWKSSSIVKHPDFDKKLSEIEIEFETVS
jgi:hypothetical protein